MSIWMILGGVVMLLAFGGASYYIGLRLYQIERAFLPPAVCYVLAGVLAVVSAALVLRFLVTFIPGLKPIKSIIYTVSSYWMGAFVYLLLFFALADILLLIGRLTRIIPSPVPGGVRLYSGIIAVCLAALLIGCGIGNARRIEVVSYETQVTDTAAKGFHIALISDLHLGAVTSEGRLDAVCDGIRELDPDIVCIAGDIFDSDFESISDPDSAAEALRRLTAEYRVYCCLGNHDAGGTFGQMESFLKKCGITCLNEEYVNIDDRITLVGRVDSSPIGAQGGYTRGDTAELLGQAGGVMPVVVIDHNPANLPQYGDLAELVLCGHTHHGQVWPGNLVTAYGYYPAQNSSPQAIITSGIGVWGLPMRIGSSCEIVSVRLV